MSALQPHLAGARVLDLFAGSGALGLETLSRGAAAVTFVERAGSALQVLRGNIERLGAADVEVVRGDAIRYVAGLEPGAFDIAVADPPYGAGFAETLSRMYLERPFAGMLWIEHRKNDPVAESESARTRTYGDTHLTQYMAPA